MTRFQHFIAAWIDLFVALIAIVTLGFYFPPWDFTFRAWAVLREIEKRKR